MSRDLVIASYYLYSNQAGAYTNVPEDISWTESTRKDRLFHHDHTKIKNVGREQGAYLLHIVNNYHDLADITIFTQGNPFPHNQNFVNVVNDISDDRVRAEGYIGLSGNKNLFPSYISGVKYELKRCFGIQNVPDIIGIYSNGLFMVSKERIHHWPKESWDKIAQVIRVAPLSLEVYTGENMWTELLGGHFENCRCGSL